MNELNAWSGYDDKSADWLLAANRILQKSEKKRYGRGFDGHYLYGSFIWAKIAIILIW